jgi:hypothetical protein
VFKFPGLLEYDTLSFGEYFPDVSKDCNLRRIILGLLEPEDKERTILRNVGNYSSIGTA